MNSSQDHFCSHCGYALDGNVTNPPTQASAQHRHTGALQANELIGGRYRIIQLIGKGGFGAVYEANDTRFQFRLVALKEMSDAHLSAQERVQALKDFGREANLLVALDHVNLPDVSDFFEEFGKAYLVMEYIQGQTLAKVLEDAQGPLDERRVMNWAVQLCDVLEYLHKQPQPIIFRDMKPANVMVTKNEQIKLIDFGIARIFKASVAKDTTSLGSRGYAPLEQYGRGQSDARSDIYALGATLYELVTNTMPVDAPSRRVNPSLFVSPRQFNPKLSVATERIILKAMEEEPQQRFQSADAMSQAILTDRLTPVGASPTYQGQQTMQQSGGQVPPLSGSYAPAFPMQQPAPSAIPRRALLAAGAVAVIGAGAWAASRVFASSLSTKPTPAVVSSSISLAFVYSTEKDRWLQAAIDAFHHSGAAIYEGKRIEIQAETSGSLDLISRIVSGESRPMAWSPASSLEVNRLSDAWQQKHAGQDVVVTNELQSLVLSPLVFAVWQSRAKVLLQKYASIDWDTVYTALNLKNGWSDIGGSSDWQRVSLGQTRPDLSNSGLLTITLMAYAYFKKTSGLSTSDIDDAGFLGYLKAFEDAVTTYGRSSGTYLENEVILKGPGAYDVTFTYENLVLTSRREIQQRQSEPLQMYYPHVNIVSDHPFVLLQGSWVKPEQQGAARVFRQFLLDVPQQQLALQYGLRPTSQNVHLTDSIKNNVFLASAARSTMHSGYRSVQLPEGSVVDELLHQWDNRYHDVATGNG